MENTELKQKVQREATATLLHKHVLHEMCTYIGSIL